MGYSHRRDDRPPETARRIARRSVQIACGSRSRDGISPPAACCAAAIRAGEAQAALCRSGVSYQQAHKYEHGINSVSAGRLLEIARALRAPITYFYEGIGEEDPRQIM